jgi:protoheme IX farnesyltransferase
MANLKAFWTLLKPRLSLLVVLSTVLSYLYANEAPIDWNNVFLLSFFGFLITGAANASNQVIEKDLDALMYRTRNRPLPSGVLSISEALVFAGILLVVGLVGIGWFFNGLAAFLSLISYALYTFIYTPLKPKTPLSVLVGAFPGALPILVGCIAADPVFHLDYFILFAIQFFWQFPHFWAIAWVLDEDYQRAGFRMLPFGRQKDFSSAYYIFMYTIVTVLVSFFPSFLQLVGTWYSVVTALAGLCFLGFALVHLRARTDKTARALMFFTFFYLPTVQLLLALDKL